MSATTNLDLVFDLSDMDTLRNPHPLFERMRAEDPVHWCAPMSAWVVTSYELITEVLTSNSVYSGERLGQVKKHLPEEARQSAEEILRWLNHWMIFKDPPDHTRLRRHMAAVLNPAVFDTFHEQVVEITEMLLDRIPRDQSFDFLKEFAIMLPGMVIMDLLGVDREKMFDAKQWSDDMMLFIGSARGVPDKYERARRGAFAMGTLFQGMIAERRKEPVDDVLSKLIHSEVNGQSMTDDELVGSMMMVLNGGHETTANLLNSMMMALANSPDQHRLLKSDHSLVNSAVEEFLRYDSPVLSVGRVVKEHTELNGKELKPGERVFPMLVSANRDSEIFDNPHSLDVTRNPNPHLAFSRGPHFCLGAHLAKLECKAVLHAVLDRYESISLEEDMSTVPWINSTVTRGPTRLQLSLT